MAGEATHLTTEFGALVRKARKAAGVRQEDLAMLAGVGRRFVIDLEAGKPTCELGRALQVAAVLRIGFAWAEAASYPRAGDHSGGPVPINALGSGRADSDSATSQDIDPVDADDR